MFETPHSLYRRPDPDVIFMRDPAVVAERQRESAKNVRDINLRVQDFETHGLTGSGCPRCAWALRHGWEVPSKLSHSAECRGRMREAIRSSGDAGRERVEAYERRRAQTAPQPDANAADAPAEGEYAVRNGGDATEQAIEADEALERLFEQATPNAEEMPDSDDNGDEDMDDATSRGVWTLRSHQLSEDGQHAP